MAGQLNKETNLIIAWHTAPVKTAEDCSNTNSSPVRPAAAPTA
jgi:hypothetical protein